MKLIITLITVLLLSSCMTEKESIKKSRKETISVSLSDLDFKPLASLKKIKTIKKKKTFKTIDHFDAIELMSKNTQFINAIAFKESSNRAKVVGDKHLRNKAYGLMQIRKPCLNDVNRVYGTSYTRQDCLNPKTSKIIFSKYISYWGKRYYINNKRIPSYQTLARIWNGGPKGYKKNSSKKYWKSVSKIMNGKS